MHPNYSVEDLEPGMLLLAEPFLEDPSFHRSVILLCEHTTAHSFGLVLNNKQEIVFDSFVDEKVLENPPAGQAPDANAWALLARSGGIAPLPLMEDLEFVLRLRRRGEQAGGQAA